MGDDDVDDVGDDVLSCPGSYYRFSPTLLPTRRELKLNCSRSHQSSVLERSYSDTSTSRRKQYCLMAVAPLRAAAAAAACTMKFVWVDANC